jgi:hypothetical protein
MATCLNIESNACHRGGESDDVKLEKEGAHTLGENDPKMQGKNKVV